MKLAKNIIIIRKIISRRIKNNKRLFVIVIRTYTNTILEINICFVMPYWKLKHKQNSWARIKLNIILFRLVAIATQRHIIYTHILLLEWIFIFCIFIICAASNCIPFMRDILAISSHSNYVWNISYGMLNAECWWYWCDH